VYDTSPAGLGLSPAYLASTSASASSTTTTSGTIFPTSPADGNIFVYLADATKGVNWAFKYNAGSASTYKWEFIGGPPLFSLVATAETTTSTTYAALSTAGPSIVLPLAGDYDTALGGLIFGPASAGVGFFSVMSYDIGGTGAVDADAVFNMNAINSATLIGCNVARVERKASLSAVTLTAKYKSTSGTSAQFQNRFLSAVPVRVSG
jgi:hypothetical protein